MIQLQHLRFPSPAAIVWLALGTTILFVITQCIYRRFFHPLAKFPGPVAASLTEFWKWRSLMSGRNAFELQDLHEKYGAFTWPRMPIRRLLDDGELT